MININNIKFKWLNDYDMYQSFIKAIKKVKFRILLLKILLKILNNEHRKYLEWRCKMNWHSKYLKSKEYMNSWINNLTKDQFDYFISKEMKYFVENGMYTG